ncbi:MULTISPECIES: phosphopantetheine-binding protein [unclassified Streptomyces]|uniref:phosphopantetheine-binding protein n=1 Tax=unclassified Streptomyces TaxID=2593676 RepID=UPI002E300E40|nr:phosphopantetheine-binding protein [Streptomyces sp. NBC_00696]
MTDSAEHITEQATADSSIEALEAVTAVWRKVLGRDDGFADDDDFFDIGGHSMLALRVVKSLALRLEMDIPLELPFRETTFGGLVAEVARLRRSKEA